MNSLATRHTRLHSCMSDRGHVDVALSMLEIRHLARQLGWPWVYICTGIQVYQFVERIEQLTDWMDFRALTIKQAITNDF